MSFSVQPDQVLGAADRIRDALDDALERSDGLRDTLASLSDALAGLPSVRAALEDVARSRVRLSRGILARGRVAVSVLRSIVLTYVAADDEMATSTKSLDVDAASFDPARFGRGSR